MVTKLNLSMIFYAFELDEESKGICNIVTPQVKYRSNRLAMGLNEALDFAQCIMERVLQDFNVEVYLDNIAIFDDIIEDHYKNLKPVIKRLEETWFKINLEKGEWAVSETDFLDTN